MSHFPLLDCYSAQSTYINLASVSVSAFLTNGLSATLMIYLCLFKTKSNCKTSFRSFLTVSEALWVVSTRLDEVYWPMQLPLF